MKIEELQIEEILDSREERTIQFTIVNEYGSFIGSSPSGKSKGKFEAPAYRGGIEEDIEKIKIREDEIKELEFNKFGDLIKIELLLKRDVGANTLIALESAILKAMAAEQRKQVWQLINPDARIMPVPIVNVIGGGQHSHEKQKPDFQEFLIIPGETSVYDNKNIVDNIYKNIAGKLRWKEWKLFPGKNDEGAYNTKMTNIEIIEFLSQYEINKGLDVAASTFYKNEAYLYSTPIRILSRDEQIKSMINTIKNNNLVYVEDPLNEEDFHGFAEILKGAGKCLVVGDDLTATHPERLKKAISMNAISGIIVKPNQSGSLLEVKKIIEIAKENRIKIIMSHRSGETQDSILADLAFGFSCDYIKISLGAGDQSKWERLIGIERSLVEAPEVEGIIEVREDKPAVKEMKDRARRTEYYDKERRYVRPAIPLSERRKEFSAAKEDNLEKMGLSKERYGAKGIQRADLHKEKEKYKYSFEKK